MKIVLISDTHGQHHNLTLPQGDLIIHAGDVSGRGGRSEVMDFLDWYSGLNYKYKVFIAGNHDFYFEKTNPEVLKSEIPDNLIYLNDSGITIEGFKIWGSPIQPWFYDWAFNRQRGAEIKKHWDLIPEDTDIVVTHGPVYGILDRTTQGEYVGCVDLLNTIKKIKPMLYVGGHIHEAYGAQEKDGITFINASVVNFHYRMVNKPVEIELHPRKTLT